MTWTHYLLVFRLESPLHIGWRKTGNLMQTRRYVPGKNLWAALTERLVWLAGRGSDPEAYQCVGKALKTCFRFGYLWPTYEERTEDWKPHFPWDEPQGPEYWDYLYLDGTARTALAPDRRTAAEGMLHEIEFIAPYTRDGRPVYLVGDLWVREDALQNRLQPCLQAAGSQDESPTGEQPTWQQALSTLQIGGERGYGWGRIRLVQCVSSKEMSWGNPWTWETQNGEVALKDSYTNTNTNTHSLHLPAHALAADFSQRNSTEKALQHVQGPIEPWLGWERGPEGFRLPEARIMYEPGAQINTPFIARLSWAGYLHR